MGEARWGVGEAMHADRIHFPPSAGLGVPRASGPMRGAHVDATDPLAFSARARAMAMSRAWVAQEPTRDAVDAMRGPVLLEFGTGWCPHCLAAEPLLDHALQQR